MVIDDVLLAELSVRNKNYGDICKLFGMTEEEKSNPNAGEWIVDRFKQYQTSNALFQALQNKKHLESPTTTPPPALSLDRKNDTAL